MLKFKCYILYVILHDILQVYEAEEKKIELILIDIEKDVQSLKTEITNISNEILQDEAAIKAGVMSRKKKLIENLKDSFSLSTRRNSKSNPQNNLKMINALKEL